MLEEYSIYFIIGFMVLTLGGTLIYIAKKGNLGTRKYDERQKQVRGRSYAIAFYYIIVSMGLLEAIKVLGIKLPVSDSLYIMSSIFIAVTIHVEYCIINDAYISLQEEKNNKNLINEYTGLLIFDVLDMYIGISKICSGEAFLSETNKLEAFSYVIFGIMALIVIITIIVKKYLMKKEEMIN